MKIVNFLDITLNLKDGTYQPYRKPNDDPIYINNKSNHPPSILKQLPTSINKRISKLSGNQETCNTAAPNYEEALQNSNFDTHISYLPQTDSHDNQPPSQKCNRNRNVIWYDPPISRNVTTNIGRLFLNLIDKHFPQSNKLHKIFNRNTLKVSYSCMDNIKSLINKHNHRILKQKTNQTPKENDCSCNCRKKNECPIPGRRMTNSVIYKAEVTTTEDQTTKQYIGMTSNAFKNRFRNHQKSFRHKKHQNEPNFQNSSGH